MWPLKYNNNKLKKQLISRLNNKFISAIKAYLDLLYTKLVAKLYALDKRFESQRAIRESYKQLNTSSNLSNKPTDKPTDSRLNRPNTTPLNTDGVDKTLIQSWAKFEALHQAGLCKKCCKPIHNKPQERCQEKTWATTVWSTIQTIWYCAIWGGRDIIII
jgi:hypothetical protein